jgi:coproporphyrinogen III oxidase-like Fe-S oxidoreductase
MAAGGSPVADTERLDEEAVALEELYLGLRTPEGVSGDRLPRDTATAWTEAGWATASGGTVRLTPEGWLRLDALTAACHPERSEGGMTGRMPPSLRSG